MRLLWADTSDIRHVIHIKFPASVVALVVVSRDGHVIPVDIFRRGLCLKAAGYTLYAMEGSMCFSRTLLLLIKMSWTKIDGGYYAWPNHTKHVAT